MGGGRQGLWWGGGVAFSAYLKNILIPAGASDLVIGEGKSGERIPPSPPLRLTSAIPFGSM